MADKLIAAIDGVMVKAGGQFRTLYKDADVPEGADADHVKVLVDRGLLVKAEAADEVDDVDGDGPIPAKSAAKDAWVAYAVSKGATQQDAEAATKDDLIAAYGSA